MTLTLDEKTSEYLENLAATQGQEPGDYVADLLKRAAARNGTSFDDTSSNSSRYVWPAIDLTNGGIQPGFIADPQERLTAYLASSWPGDETEEDMQALADWIDD